MGQGFDWAVAEAIALVVNALHTLAFLLIVDCEGCTCRLEQAGKWGCVGDDVLE